MPDPAEPSGYADAAIGDLDDLPAAASRRRLDLEEPGGIGGPRRIREPGHRLAGSASTPRRAVCAPANESGLQLPGKLQARWCSPDGI